MCTDCQLFGLFSFLLFMPCMQGRNHGSKVEGDHHGERGSASLYGGLGALPPEGSRGKAPGGGLGGEAPLKLKPILQLQALISA
jgi:hypothetical protein